MDAITALKSFFSRERDVAAVYLYGHYAETRTWADSDLEIALLFQERLSEEEIGAYLERLSNVNPLGDVPGVVMPSALNTHILPVIYEILVGATAIVTNDPDAKDAFARDALARVEEERQTMLEEAQEAILQARNLGLVVTGTSGFVLPQPPKYLDPVRIGWRLARILASAAVIEPSTRDSDAIGRDPERLGQLIGWFSNAAGAATGIAKAMLSIFGMPRPSRRWEVFLPLADANLMTTELALQLASTVESRWQLLTGTGLTAPDRIVGTVRGSLAPIVAFARLAAWYADIPGAKADQKVH